MSRWKRVALIGGVGAVVVTLGVGISRAAAPGGFLGRRMRIIQVLRELQVTQQQRRQLRDAALHLRVERQALELEAVSPETRRERLFQLRREFFAKAQQTLTPEQGAKLKNRWEAGRSARQQAFEQRALAAADRLQLTAEQRTRARELFASARTRVDQLKLQPGMDEPTRLARLLGILEETRGDLYRILTPEQQAKAKELIEKRLREAVPADPLGGTDAGV